MSDSTALKCPHCVRTFLMGPTFVMEVLATGRVQKAERGAKRAEVQCGICGHTWWSRHPDAFRKALAAAKR